MSFDKATPRPWHLNRALLTIYAQPDKGEDRLICDMPIGPKKDEAGVAKSVQSEIDADHIVRCVNAYEDLVAALRGIAKLGGLTLLGGDGMESDRAYQHGANAAFGQAAEIARSALQRSGDAK